MHDPGAERSALDELDAAVDAVEAALRRIEDGTYARCESCGEAIDGTELEQDPARCRCARCEASWRS
jgi:DnaK suppressor protein